MSYTFVFENDGWWLKIDSVEQLKEYYESIEEKRTANAFLDALYSKEFNEAIALNPIYEGKELSTEGKNHASTHAYAMILRAQNNHKSLAWAATDMHMWKFSEQLKVITEEDRAVLINRYGGWHPGQKSGYKNWCHKDKLIFPDFKKNQIRVSKFPDGAHFYAYIDDLQVRDGDILKWNTYDEAYNHALAYINE